MKKILVTDLFGTLVPDNFEQAHNLYGNGKKPNLLEITGDKDYLRYLVEKISEQSMNDLNKFLDEGNIAFIVCNLTAHDITIDIILDKLIKRFHNYSDNNFYLFFVANDNAGYFDIKRLSNEATDKYVENGVNYFVYNNDKIVIIKKKEDVFDIIKNKYNLQDYKLFSIGNKQDDIPMLIKSVELGGRGSLLNYELYTDEELNKKMIDQAIVFKIRIEHLLLTEQELLSHNPNFSKMSQEEQCKLKQKYLYCGGLLKWFNSINEYKKRLPEIYRDLNEGKLNLDELIKKHLVYETFYGKMRWGDLNEHTLTESVWNKIDMYSTFRDYYNNVLSHEIIRKNDAPKLVKKIKATKED